MANPASVQQVRYDIPQHDNRFANFAILADAAMTSFQKRKEAERLRAREPVEDLSKILPGLASQGQLQKAPPGTPGAIDYGGAQWLIGGKDTTPSSYDIARTAKAQAETTKINQLTGQEPMSSRILNQRYLDQILESDFYKIRTLSDPIEASSYARKLAQQLTHETELSNELDRMIANTVGKPNKNTGSLWTTEEVIAELRTSVGNRGYNPDDFLQLRSPSEGF